MNAPDCAPLLDVSPEVLTKVLITRTIADCPLSENQKSSTYDRNEGVSGH